FDPEESPRNNNWYFLTLAARRGLTYLQQQPQVDPNRLGIHGYSMGGTISMYTAGADHRLKAAVPAVGGSGFRTYPLPLLPESTAATVERINGDVELFRQTMDHHIYAAHVECPLLFLSASNDFHGIMDQACLSCALIPAKYSDGSPAVALAFTPHYNHRLMPEFEIDTLLWYDAHLKKNFKMPKSPKLSVDMKTESGQPRVALEADQTLPVSDVVFYVSFDPCPTARFWRTIKSVPTQGKNNVFTAEITDIPPELPLVIYANVCYTLPEETTTNNRGTKTKVMALSTPIFSCRSEDVVAAKVKTVTKMDDVIDTFEQPLSDWMLFNETNRDHWRFETRKLNDPRWMSGVAEDTLVLELVADAENKFAVELTSNFFRGYRGPMKKYYAAYSIQGTGKPEQIAMRTSDFISEDGKTPLNSWAEVDLFSLAGRQQVGDRVFGGPKWNGAIPTWKRLSWERAKK
ncbi:MAG: dienelactone hydrolase family protein, partial [Thermoguttaceae bacterium]